MRYLTLILKNKSTIANIEMVSILTLTLTLMEGKSEDPRQGPHIQPHHNQFGSKQSPLIHL